MGQKTALGSLLKAIGNSGQGKVVPGWGGSSCDDSNRITTFSLLSYSSANLQPITITTRFLSRLEWKLDF